MISSLERSSEHPLAPAILAAAVERKINPPDITNFRYQTGKGITGTVDGSKAGLGNRALFAGLAIPIRDLEEQARSLEADGQTVICSNGWQAGRPDRSSGSCETHNRGSHGTFARAETPLGDAHRR